MTEAIAAIPKFDEPNLQAVSDILGDTSTGLTGCLVRRRLDPAVLLEYIQKNTRVASVRAAMEEAREAV
jgi:hypothetical protein